MAVLPKGGRPFLYTFPAFCATMAPMQYHARFTPSGRVILNRSSVRYLFSIIFFILSLGFFLANRLMDAAIFSFSGLSPLLPLALCLIFGSASLIILLNRGTPSRIVADGEGLILIQAGKNLRVPKAEILAAKAVDTMSLDLEHTSAKRAISQRVLLELKSGTTLPVMETANGNKAKRYVQKLNEALDHGPVYKKKGGILTKLGSAGDLKHGALSLFRKEENATILTLPIKFDPASFLMGGGALSGFGIILFAILPGKIESTILIMSFGIWGLFCLSFIAAFFRALLGRQELIFGERNLECHRHFLGMGIPVQTMPRAEAAKVILDLEQGSLSIISKELKRILSESPQGQMGEKLGELLGGRSIRMNLSALRWCERLELERRLNDILEISESGTAIKKPRADSLE